MMSSLLLRTLYEKRWFMSGWSAVFIAMTTLVMAFFPSFKTGSIESLASSLPSQLQGLIGNLAEYSSIEGFISLQVYDIRMSLLVIIMTLVLAISLTINEEQTGEMRTLLSVGIGRQRMVVEKLLAAFVIIVVINIVALGGIYLGIAMVGEGYPHGLLLHIAALSIVFSTAVFSIPFGLALFSGNKNLTLFVSLFIAIGSYLLSTFARTVEWLKGWEIVSIIHYFDTAGLRHQTFQSADGIILILIAIVFIGVGYARYRVRDIS